jgi:hypothetical protein
LELAPRPSSATAVIITTPIVSPIAATPAIIARLALPGRGARETRQPQASGEQRCPHPDNVTPRPRLLRIGADHILDHPRLLLSFPERAVPIPPGSFGIYPYDQRS